MTVSVVYPERRVLEGCEVVALYEAERTRDPSIGSPPRINPHPGDVAKLARLLHDRGVITITGTIPPPQDDPHTR